MIAYTHHGTVLYLAEPPRSGTSSIRDAIMRSPHWKNGGELHPRRHILAHEAQPAIDEHLPPITLIAIAVRNPYARARSLFHWFAGPQNLKNWTLAKIIQRNQSADDSWPRHFSGTSLFEPPPTATAPTVIRIHIEHPGPGIHLLEQLSSAPLAKLRHHNAFRPPQGLRPLSPADIATAADHYYREFVRYGYDPNDTRLATRPTV